MNEYAMLNRSWLMDLLVTCTHLLKPTRSLPCIFSCRCLCHSIQRADHGHDPHDLQRVKQIHSLIIIGHNV